MSLVQMEAPAHRPSWRRHLAILVGLLALAAPSWAVPTINFFIEPDTGLVSFDNTMPLNGMSGLGIGVSSFQGVDTPSGPLGVIPCVNCELNFGSGPFLGAAPNAWFFAPGGPISITRNGTTLLTGVLVGPTVTVDLLVGPQVPAIGLTTSAIFDLKHPFLSGLYGLPPFPFEGDLRLTWAGLGDPDIGNGSSFIGSAKSGTVTNRFIPEPATLLLFGTGLLGMLGVSRRRR